MYFWPGTFDNDVIDKISFMLNELFKIIATIKE
jgi:hypothetical protein